MKIVIGYEWKYRQKHWLHRELEKLGYEIKVIDCPDMDRTKKLKKWHKIIELLNYLKIARQANKIIQEEDIFVGWCFTTGVIFAILNKNKCSKILALNILIQPQKSISGVLRNWLYRKAFKNSNFIATANTQQGIEQALNILGKGYRNQFSILHDAFISKPREGLSDNYCFAGGASGRDWPTVLKVARLCPEISFHVVASRKSWNFLYQVPSNVKLRFDIPASEFETEELNAKLFILPVLNEMTSGLLVLFDGINMGKIVVASNTEAISNYYPEDCKSLLVPIGGAHQMAEKVKSVYYEDTEKISNKILVYNQTYNSPRRYVSSIVNIIVQ